MLLFLKKWNGYHVLNAALLNSLYLIVTYYILYELCSFSRIIFFFLLAPSFNILNNNSTNEDGEEYLYDTNYIKVLHFFVITDF